MRTYDGQPAFTLAAEGRQYHGHAIVHVHPSVLGPDVVLQIRESAMDNGGVMRNLTPEQAREVAKALTEAAEIVESGTYRPWEDEGQRAPDEITSALAAYWFSKLELSVAKGDFILANVAKEKLKELGWEVKSIASQKDHE
jgi:rRNA maturation endonuclease Nob1